MSAQKTDPATASWHIDKRVPLALIGAIVLQSAVFGAFIATMRSDIDNNKNDIAMNRDTLAEMRASQRVTRDDLTGRVIRIEVILEEIREAVTGRRESRSR